MISVRYVVLYVQILAQEPVPFWDIIGQSLSK